MSRDTAPRLLGLLAILLLVVIAYELLASHSDETDMIVANAQIPADVRSPGATVAPAEPIGQWVSVALARPLFNADRRPDKGATPAVVNIVSEDSNELPRLAGILLLGESKSAVFQPGGDKKPIIVAEGDAIAGWTVQTIKPTEVTLTGPGGTTTLEPKFDENMVPPAPQMPAVLSRPPVVPPRLNAPGGPGGVRNVLPPNTPIIPKLGVPPGRLPRREPPASPLQQQQQPVIQQGNPLITPPTGVGQSREGGR